MRDLRIERKVGLMWPLSMEKKDIAPHSQSQNGISVTASAKQEVVAESMTHIASRPLPVLETRLNEQLQPRDPSGTSNVAKKTILLTGEDSNRTEPILIERHMDLVLELSTFTSSGFHWHIATDLPTPTKTNVPLPVAYENTENVEFGGKLETHHYRWQAADLPTTGSIFTIAAEMRRSQSIGSQAIFKIKII